MAYIFQRLVALVVLLVGWDMSSHSGWRYLIGLLAFGVGIVCFEWVVRREVHRELMPHRWDCPVCKRKGNGFRINAYSHEALDAVRLQHNRTVHLLEP